jgi:malate dehydrogenase (oxaloacetate-decarboxylating)
VLNAGVRDITHTMLVAAAEAIANSTRPGDLVPHPLNLAVHESVSEAVERAAVVHGEKDGVYR